MNEGSERLRILGDDAPHTAQPRIRLLFPRCQKPLQGTLTRSHAASRADSSHPLDRSALTLNLGPSCAGIEVI